MKTFVDLFAGIGGFRVALERRGLTCVFTSEIDKYAKDVYRRNFGCEPDGDIREVEAQDIPKHDILCAGFPCQSFSISGNHTGFRDNRGQLFYEICRIAEYHKPSILLLENVKNILTINKGQVLSIIKTQLDEIGYDVHYSLLNASNYGIPQSRERVYFTCLRKGSGLKFHEPLPTNQQIFLRDILNPDVDDSLTIKRDDIVIEKQSDAETRLAPIRVGYVNKGGQGERIYHPNGHSITLSAAGGGVGARTGLYLSNGKIRKLSLDECKRLMSFSDNHIVSSGTQGYKQKPTH